MIAHMIHDDAGRISSVVFQATEIEGELEIEVSQKGESVTAIDLNEIFPGIAVDAGPDGGSSRHGLHLLAREIRDGFRVDQTRKTLERLKPGKP